MAQPKANPKLDRLRRQLKRVGVTQVQVAEAAGVSTVHVCNVLAGRDASRRVLETARRLVAEKGSNGAGGAVNAVPTPDHAA